MTPAHDDTVARLNAACVGHPVAEIAWPHRVLHEARDTILSYAERIKELEADRDSWRRVAERLATEKQTLEEAVAPFVRADIQKSEEMVRVIWRRWKGFQPVNVTVTKDQFIKARRALNTSPKTGNNIGEKRT